MVVTICGWRGVAMHKVTYSKSQRNRPRGGAVVVRDRSHLAHDYATHCVAERRGDAQPLHHIEQELAHMHSI